MILTGSGLGLILFLHSVAPLLPGGTAPVIVVLINNHLGLVPSSEDRLDPPTCFACSDDASSNICVIG